MLIGMACLMRHTNQHVGLCGCQNPIYNKQTSDKIITHANQTHRSQLIYSFFNSVNFPNTASKYLVAYKISTSMSQQLLKQEMTISQILRTYGNQFKQIRGQYSDGFNGRCAIGVIMSYMVGMEIQNSVLAQQEVHWLH
jgi:hypothetical protein